MRRFDYNALADKTWDMGILNLVARIHEYKGRQVLFVRQKQVELARLSEIARIQSTEASNKIEGIVTTGVRMKQLIAGKATPRNRDEDEIMGYCDVLNTIHESSDFIPLRSNYILQLHRDLFKRSGRSFGGKYKNVQNSINKTHPDGTVITRFTPVAPNETPEAVEAICAAYTQAEAGERVDALILIPVFICDFLCIHPFNDGNGRMSRLLTLLLLYRSDYDVGKYISIEKQIENTKDRYYEALEAADSGWHEAQNDPTPFIRYMLQVLLACYTEFEDRLSAFDNEGRRSTAYDTVKHYVLEKVGKFTSADVIVQCPSIGRSSALAALKQLTAEGTILRYGSGRSTYYVRAEDQR